MELYTDWKLEKLKAELRKRHVQVSGRKAELVERLQDLDAIGRFAPEMEPGTHTGKQLFGCAQHVLRFYVSDKSSCNEVIPVLSYSR